MERFYKIGEFADKIGVTITTLRRWDKEGKLKPAKVTDGGTRYYTESQYRLYSGVGLKSQNKVVIGYARVNDKSDFALLEKQISNIKEYMYAKGYQFEIITDIGAGADYSRDGLLQMLERVVAGGVSKVVVLNRLVLSSVGFDLIKFMCELCMTDVEVIDLTHKPSKNDLSVELSYMISSLTGLRSKSLSDIVESIL